MKHHIQGLLEDLLSSRLLKNKIISTWINVEKFASGQIPDTFTF